MHNISSCPQFFLRPHNDSLACNIISAAKSTLIFNSFTLYSSVISKGWLRRKLGVLDLLVCLACQEENRLWSGQQRQAQFGLHPALGVRYSGVCHSQDMS